MGRDPLTRARSPWVPVEPIEFEGTTGEAFQRRVHDGHLSAIRSREPHGLHLSVSHTNASARRDRAERYPTWDELAHARYELTPVDVDMVMILPAEADYVAHHPTTFHLHQIDDLPRRGRPAEGFPPPPPGHRHR